jgi:hypothetical protein
MTAPQIARRLTNGHARRASNLILLALAAMLCAGCWSQTQFGADNYRLLASLQTAISAKRTDWLEAAEKSMAGRHAAGQLNDEQHRVLEAIVGKARAEDWDGAQADIVRLQKGQRPGDAQAGK